MTFVQWIDLKGPAEIAKLLGVNIFTVHHWRANRADPRVKQMRRIKKLTRGVIGYDQMIDRGQE